MQFANISEFKSKLAACWKIWVDDDSENSENTKIATTKKTKTKTKKQISSDSSKATSNVSLYFYWH